MCTLQARVNGHNYERANLTLKDTKHIHGASLNLIQVWDDGFGFRFRLRAYFLHESAYSHVSLATQGGTPLADLLLETIHEVLAQAVSDTASSEELLTHAAACLVHWDIHASAVDLQMFAMIAENLLALLHKRKFSVQGAQERKPQLL